MPGDIPRTAFRLDHGYTFPVALRTDEPQAGNVVVGQSSAGTPMCAFFLGKLAEFQAMNKKVWLDSQGAHAVYVMGKRRSGKTFTLGVLAEGLVASGWINQGREPQAVLILDTMNVFLTMPHVVLDTFGKDHADSRELARWGIAAEKPNLTLYFPRGTEAPPEGSPRELSLRAHDLGAEDWAALFEVDTYSDPIGQLIAEVHECVAIEGYGDRNQRHVPPKPEYAIDDLLACLDNNPRVDRYESRTVEAVRRRLSAVRRLSIFSSGGTDIKEVFRPGHVSVVLLRDLDHRVRGLLIGSLVKRIMDLRSVSDRYERLAAVHLARHGSMTKDSPEALAELEVSRDYTGRAVAGLGRGWIIIDEAHNYIPSRGVVASKAPLRKYINEGRNLGLSIVVATQQPSGLDPAIQRNADILIVHAMSMRDDIATAEAMVNTFIPDRVTYDGREEITTRTFEQLVRSLDRGYAVISTDRANRVFPVKIRPRLTVHGGKEY